MKNRLLYIFIIIMIFAGSFVTAETSQVTEKKGVNAFLTFLNDNKDTFKYESFGSFEHGKTVEVRIYCNENSKNEIVKYLGEYSYQNYNYKNHTLPTGILHVMFLSEKNGKRTFSGNSVKVKCPRKVPVKVSVVKNENINEYKYFDGKLADGGVTSIVSPVDGTVKGVLVKAGDKIEPGDRILDLDFSDIDTKIAEAQKSLNDWKKRLKRRRGWKVRSPKAERQAERKLEEFTKLLEDLEKEKKNSSLSSETGGQLTSIVDPGSEIKNGEEIASVRDNSQMRMEISSDEIMLFEGMEEIKVKVVGKGDFTASVKREGGRLFVVIDNSDFSLTSSDRAGFRVLYKEYRNVPVLDKSLILKDQTGEFVYTIEKKRAKKRYIKTGAIENGKVMVESGIIAGNGVIVTLSSCLKEGKKIKITEGELPPEIIVKKKEKKRVPAIKKKKVVKKEEPETGKVKYIKKPVPESEIIKKAKTRTGEWGEFDNCPSVTKVRVRKVTAGELYGSEKYSSFIDSEVKESILSETAGKIAAVYFTAGQKVKKGDLLMEFDSSDIELKKSEKQTQLDQWKKVLSEVEVWEERNEQLENEIKDKIRNISLQIASLHRSEIEPRVYSPVSGIVRSIASSGAEVKEGDLLSIISDTSRFRIPVKLKSGSENPEGYKIEVTFDGISGRFEGTFSEVKGQYWIVIDNTYNNLKRGMKAKVLIFRKYENRVILSKSEMLRDSGGIFVYVAKNDRAIKRYVKILSFGKTRVAVESGVKKGEEIIITNLDCVDDNKKIKIMAIDAVTGKLVKRGKKSPKEIKREKVAKKRFAVGVGGAYLMISDQIFKDVYGTSNISPMFTLSFKVTKKIDVFFNTFYLPKSGSTLSVDKVDLTYYEFNLGLRYLFGRSEKMLPFLGLGVNSLAVKEKSDEINLDTVYKTSTGAMVTAGVFYEITPGLDFLLDLRYDLNKMKAGEGLEDIDFSGIRLLMGIIFRF